MNEEVLTDEESDALLEQSAERARSPQSGVHDVGEEFWEQVTPGRIPTLETINAGIADALTELWQTMFRRKILVSAQLPLQTNGRRLVESIEFEDGVKSFDVQTRNEQCLLVVQPETISSMVDLCFGGTGRSRSGQRPAALTEMEKRLYARFCDGIRERLNEQWRIGGDVTFQESAQPFDSSMHSLCEPGARSVSSRFVFDIDQNEHSIEFFWSQGTIDGLIRGAPKALPAAAQGDDKYWSKRIGEELKGAKIELRAVIGGIGIRLHEISNARTGDIIMTEPLNKVCLLSGSQPVFEGTLGSHEGFNAVKISQPYVQKRSGDA
ncbi:MAG: FliM/FliN family flagellar motor switch protein [Gammaproteobacteria bacterium]|jgi:flagellar motor switch protein FliM